MSLDRTHIYSRPTFVCKSWQNRIISIKRNLSFPLHCIIHRFIYHSYRIKVLWIFINSTFERTFKVRIMIHKIISRHQSCPSVYCIRRFIRHFTQCFRTDIFCPVCILIRLWIRKVRSKFQLIRKLVSYIQWCVQPLQRCSDSSPVITHIAQRETISSFLTTTTHRKVIIWSQSCLTYIIQPVYILIILITMFESGSISNDRGIE